MDTEREIKRLPFWNDLTPAERETVLRCARIREYKSGSLIYSPEQECLGLIKLLSGSIRTFMLSEEGREVVLYRMKEGDIDLLSAACVVNQITFETQMVAQSDCTVLVVPATCLAQFKRDNLAVRCFIFEKLGERFSDVMKLMQTMLFTRIDRRIAALLREKAEAGGKKEIRMTHEEIAAMINSSREVVSRTLKGMERSGLLTLGRGKITLHDDLDTFL
ncbi:MAG: Crp/Fnr family transcriptional regulator [Clostridia bacterium]|nr:Crp/Fnr family transcriptional regulator [Clostridia bacterium]